MKIFTPLIAMSIYAALAGCSSKVDITGEVFVETGQGATKLPLVSIQIISEDKLKTHIAATVPKAMAKAAELRTKIAATAVREQESAALRAQAAALGMVNDTHVMMGGIGSSGVLSSSLDLQRAVRESERVSGEALRQAQSDAKEVNDLESGASAFYFSGNIDGALITTQTDSDGKYKLTIDSGKNYILVATKDNLAWAMRIKPAKDPITLSLTNKNLSGSGCSECVFGKDATPVSFVEAQGTKK